MLVDRSGTFTSAFVLAIVISLVGVLAWTTIIPRIEPVAWRGRSVIAVGGVAPT
jgi:hypothetical protein